MSGHSDDEKRARVGEFKHGENEHTWAGRLSIKTIEKLRFADTDRLGHITNTVFAVCAENARMELLCDPKRVPIPRNTQFVIAKLVLEFRAEMHWPGTVEIGTRVERVGRSSVSLTQACSSMRLRCHRPVRCSADGHDDAAVGTPPGADRRGIAAMGWPSSGRMPTAATSVVLLHR